LTQFQFVARETRSNAWRKRIKFSHLMRHDSLTEVYSKYN
jgi:hypothetical protein